MVGVNLTLDSAPTSPTTGLERVKVGDAEHGSKEVVGVMK
jgi:hypothetical protein